MSPLFSDGQEKKLVQCLIIQPVPVKSFNHYSGPSIIGQIRTKYFSCLSDYQCQDLVYKFKNSDSEMFEEHEVFLKNFKSVFELERDIFLTFIDTERKN